MTAKTLFLFLLGALVLLGCELHQPTRAPAPAAKPAPAPASTPKAAPAPAPEPQGTWETTTETLMTRSCKFVYDRKEGARRRRELEGMYRESFRGSPLEETLPRTLASAEQDPVVEKCRQVTIQSPKAALQHLARKFWREEEPKALHGVWCNGEYKESPKNDASFMIAEIQKRPGVCAYTITQEREVAETGQPTKQEMWLTYEADGTWTLERRLFTPSSSWLD